MMPNKPLSQMTPAERDAFNRSYSDWTNENRRAGPAPPQPEPGRPQGLSRAVEEQRRLQAMRADMERQRAQMEQQQAQMRLREQADLARGQADIDMADQRRAAMERSAAAPPRMQTPPPLPAFNQQVRARTEQMQREQEMGLRGADGRRIRPPTPAMRPAPAWAAGFQRVFDNYGNELPPNNPAHPNYADAMARLQPTPPTPPTRPERSMTPDFNPPRPPVGPAFKKGGAVKAAPVKKKAGGVIAKPKAAPVKAKAKPMPAFKKGGMIKKGKK